MNVGVVVSVVLVVWFVDFGFICVVLRGGWYVGVYVVGDFVVRVCLVIRDGGFCYGYHVDFDMFGYVYGFGFELWWL